MPIEKLSANFYKPEVRCGYFISEEQKKIWAVQIDLLVKFMEVCDKHKLKYFVAHGTLLGAVRHKGFIPWDDDIDINMPREDYAKLQQIADREFKEPYKFQCTENEEELFLGMGRLRDSSTTGVFFGDIDKKCNKGIWIDIFPMDGIIEDERQRKRQSKRVEFFRQLILAYTYRNVYKRFYDTLIIKWKIRKLIARCLCKIFSFKWLIRKFNNACKEGNTGQETRTGIIAFKTDYECCYWNKEDFGELILLKFEHLKVPAPKGYDRCLKIKWNNYMEYPPVCLRGNKHADHIFDPGTPYKEFDFSIFTNFIDAAKGKRVVLFGGGLACRDYMKYYGKKIRPKCIYDNDQMKWSTHFKGLPIKDPEELKYTYNEKTLVLITSSYFKEIREQLKNMGIHRYYVYIYGRKYR